MISNRVRLAHALTDDDWIISGVDQGFCELLKMREEDLIGRHVLDITHPDDRAGNWAAMEGLVRDSRAFWIDKRYIRPDGEAVAVRNHITAIRQGDRTQFLATSTVRYDNDDRRCAAVFSALDDLAVMGAAR